MDLESRGFEIIRKVLGPSQIEILISELSTGANAGRRGIAVNPAIVELTDSAPIRSLLPNQELRLVRAILFDKSPDANWPVAWHQDRTITVSEKKDLPGYGPWTFKEETHHVEPPAQVLEAMVTIRLHLDDTPAENGALRVISGTHLGGKLTPEQVASQNSHPQVVAACDAGDALLMKPLLLHSSPRAKSPPHRRVIHLEFADLSKLDNRLIWKAF